MTKVTGFAVLALLLALGCGETATGTGGTAGSDGTAGTGGAPPPPPPPRIDQTCRDWCANELEGPSCHLGPFESVQPCHEDCLEDYQREAERQCGDEWIAIQDCQLDLDCEDFFGDCDSVEDVHDECLQRAANRDFCEANCPDFDLAQCEQDTTECRQLVDANSFCESRCPNQNREACIAQYIAGGTCDDGCPAGEIWCDGACTPEIEPTLAGIQASVFDISCTASACHNDQFRAEMLTLTSAEVSAANLIDVEAVQMSKPRVDPGNVENSYLIDKLLGVDIAPGTEQAPFGGIPLCAAKIEAVKAWIAVGAPE